MTNGEKMKEIFPNAKIGYITIFDLDWVNAEYEKPTTNNDCAKQNGCITCSLDDGDDCCRKLYEESMQEPTTKNDLGVDCISREQALSEFCIYNTYDNIGVDKVREILKTLPPVTPQEPKKGYLSIDDIISVFDDFMCGEVDEDGTETFLKMLRDKADMRGEK